MKTTPTEETHDTFQKPKWLSELEKQSWQVELLASGMAIYGSLALGPFLDDLVSYTHVYFSDQILSVMVFVFVYSYLAQKAIVVCFISHLVLRIVWAGLLGLNSIYPKGIKTEHSTFDPNFLTKLKKDFPNLSQYSLQLDKLCSSLFSNFCSLAMIMLSIVIWILFILLLGELLNYCFGLELFTYLFIFFSLFYMLGIPLVLLTSKKKTKKINISSNLIYNLLKWHGKITQLFLYKPINYISWIQQTNDSTKNWIGKIVIFVFIALLFIFDRSENFELLKSNKFFEANATTYDATHHNYLDEVQTTLLLRPIIQSHNITGNYIELFIPKLEREKIHKVKICGEPNIEHLEKIEKKRKILEFEEQCAEKYFKISFDEGETLSVQFNYRKHAHNNEIGYLAYIPLNTLSNGYHVLHIKTGYANKEGEFAKRLIPFYISSNNS